jgi:hypothetical protein
MEPWTKVKWSEARQIAEVMGLDEAEWPEEGIPPQAWYQKLIAQEDLELAVALIGHALSRFEAVAWAARLLESQSRSRKLAPRDQQALDRSLRWLDEPSDDYRREAFVASEQAGVGTAERLLGSAVFLSGGSIAPVDLPPVNPPAQLSGRLAASAVLVAAHRTGDAAAALREALAAGERIAASGLGIAAVP